jgi:hypothetical protein
MDNKSSAILEDSGLIPTHYWPYIFHSFIYNTLKIAEAEAWHYYTWYTMDNFKRGPHSFFVTRPKIYQLYRTSFNA